MFTLPSPELPITARKSRRLGGYAISLVVGAFVVGMLGGLLADIDDAGGLQMLIGGCLGLVVYRRFF